MPASSPSPAAAAPAVTPSRSRNSNTRNQSTAPTYGYHNTFHTHAKPLTDLSPPPSYARAIDPRVLERLNTRSEAETAALEDPIPPYTCTVELEGVLGVKQELSSPFAPSTSREWHDVYVVLRGTQLQISRVKTPRMLSRNRHPVPGRLLKTFSMQHAEIGIASDFKKTPLVPRTPFAHLIPAAARPKLYESDPHLFEPVREHVLRLRLETEQFLLSCSAQDDLLDWVEALCAAVDISAPLEDRESPRYRSLPRRNRRQRALDGRLTSNIENLTSLEAGRRFVAEQERIIMQLYPNLARSTSESTNTAPEETTQPESRHVQEPLEANEAQVDPDTEDLDPADVRMPQRPDSSSMTRSRSRNDASQSDTSSDLHSSNPKEAPPMRHTPAQAQRYRRRCAPVLLATSPRVSDVVFYEGRRVRINVKQRRLVDYAEYPPRYDSHSFPKKPQPLRIVSEESAPSRPGSIKATITATQVSVRPASPMRGTSNHSLANSFNSMDPDTFGYDLSSASSEQSGRPPRLENDTDEIRTIPATSEPPSPTTACIPSQAKQDVARRLNTLGKTRSSEEIERGDGLSVVAMGVGLLI